MEEILRHLDQKTNSILDSQKAKIKIKEGIMKEIEKIWKKEIQETTDKKDITRKVSIMKMN